MKLLICVLSFPLSIGAIAAEKILPPEERSANYKEARFLVGRDLPIQAIDIQKFVEFEALQPPKNICIPSTPDCWIVRFSVEGKVHGSGQVETADRILSAPLPSRKHAENYISTLKNWEKYRNHVLYFERMRVIYPPSATLLLIRPALLSLPDFLKEHRLIYRFALNLSHAIGFADAAEVMKPRIMTDFKCPKDGCSFGMAVLSEYGFFVKEAVFDFRVIANPKSDR